MENKYSNYDMFDKLIANNKKAQSWTIFWVIALCLLAGSVIYLAIVNSQKNKTIADLNINVGYKTRVIDSLKDVIQKEVSKKVDSISDYITSLNTDIQKIERDAPPQTVESVPAQVAQRENLKAVNTSIRQLNMKVQEIKTDLQKEKLRFFIQYNNKADEEEVNKLAGYLKSNDNYFIAPSEYLYSNFGTSIKVYNYANTDDENRLKELISKFFKLPPESIKITHPPATASVTKPTIEIWIGTLKIPVNQMNAPVSQY